MRIATSLLLACALGAGCARSGVRDFDGFEGAVDAGQPCSELYEIRATMKKDLAEADALLARIGCTSASATRTDR